jgi:hypothetical protein
MVNAAHASTAGAPAPPSALHLLISRSAIKNARNSPENNALNFSNWPKSACLRARSSPVLRAKKHESRVAGHGSRFTTHQSLLSNHAFLIATQILELDLTPSQQTRKLFLIATKFDISPPHLTNHHSPIAPFLFDTNKGRKIIILARAPMKTKEKQFSIRYKFAPRDIGSVSPITGMKSVRNFRCYSNAACLAVLVVLTCPAASGPNWFAWLGMGA